MHLPKVRVVIEASMVDRHRLCALLDHNGNNNHEVLLSSWPRSLREFGRFFWWMQSSAKRPPSLRPSHLTDLGCESACFRQLSSTTTIAIYHVRSVLNAETRTSRQTNAQPAVLRYTSWVISGNYTRGTWPTDSDAVRFVSVECRCRILRK